MILHQNHYVSPSCPDCDVTETGDKNIALQEAYMSAKLVEVVIYFIHL
jgi:hypothetical protein